MDDLIIKNNIAEQLSWDERLDGSTINIEVQRGIARLTGTVDSYYAKNAAEQNVLQVRGVSVVKNELKVNNDQLTTPTDKEVRSRVKDLLYWNNDIDYSQIDVLVNNHVVTLFGSVSAYWKAVLVEELAYSIRGVTMVINQLSVVPSKDYEDKKIADDIIQALERTEGVVAHQISVRVDKGLVTLEGEVLSWRDKKAVFNAALYTRGVKNIINNTKVASTEFAKKI